MRDTKRQYENNPDLVAAVKSSIQRQYMVAHEDTIDIPELEAENTTEYIVSGKRSFEAAKNYKGKKVAVLNFANNHAIGGSPYYANAQEESLCKCSTLLACLTAMEVPFYIKHREQFARHEIDHMGNDDLIYTPDVVVFKTDERTFPIHPQMMPREEWYQVDVITCAAPEMQRVTTLPPYYRETITSRIKKILDVAAKEKVEVLILGAWGCGAFKNPSEIVASVFKEQLQHYDFQTVEFALASNSSVSDSVFN